MCFQVVKKMKNNTYAKESEAGIFFWKLILNLYTRASKIWELGVNF